MFIKLKKLRVKKGLTQIELSLLSGISQPYINELEKGNKKNPTLETLKKLATALEANFKDLI